MEVDIRARIETFDAFEMVWLASFCHRGRTPILA
jgi:hypothetical protein